MLLWRDAYLKPLSQFDLGTERCPFCNQKFIDLDFVICCEFCEIGTMHDLCANLHIMEYHIDLVNNKVEAHKDKPLHDYQ
jgi:hypothetical protein